jgi:hypothetical protein
MTLKSQTTYNLEHWSNKDVSSQRENTEQGVVQTPIAVMHSSAALLMQSLLDVESSSLLTSSSKQPYRYQVLEKFQHLVGPQMYQLFQKISL